MLIRSENPAASNFHPPSLRFRLDRLAVIYRRAFPGVKFSRLAKMILLSAVFLFVAWRADAQLDYGINPANLGKGDWIYQMTNCELALGVSTPQAVLQYEANKGVQWVAVNGADGADTIDFPQYNTNLIAQAHALGMKLFVWVYAYGNYYNPTNLPGEITAALTVLGENPDGLIIDAEGEYEGQAMNATTYCTAIRAQYPTRFVAYAPYPVITDHATYPYIQFGSNCNCVMPQCYWANLTDTVSEMVSDLDSEWSTWQNGLGSQYASSIKPIAPVGQGFAGTGYNPGTDITTFVNLLVSDADPATAGGYKGVSFWNCQLHEAADWTAIGAATIGSPNPVVVLSRPGISSLTVTGGNLVINAANGIQGSTYELLRSADPTLPPSQWTPITTNILSAAGNFTITVSNAVTSNPRQFYLLKAF